MMYFPLNFITILTVLVSWLLKSINATSCPTDRLTWEERAGNFTCVDNSYVYHCILDDTDRLVETCAARAAIPEGKPGCPVVKFIDRVAYHLDDNSGCPLTNPYCPSGKSAYYSDQLYLYPVCFRNENERDRYRPSTPVTPCGYESSTEKHHNSAEVPRTNTTRTMFGDKEPDGDSPSTVLIPIIVVLTLVSLVSLPLNVFLMCRYCPFAKDCKDAVPSIPKSASHKENTKKNSCGRKNHTFEQVPNGDLGHAVAEV